MNEPKYVLFISYYFPPAGGPGVQRVTKFVRYLRELGWTPIVLVPENAQYQALDPSLEKEIPAGTIIRRTSIFEPHNLYKKFIGVSKDTALDVNVNVRSGEKASLKKRFASFIRSTFFVPDARVGWIRSAVREGVKLTKEFPVSVIYTSSPPYSVALIGKKIAKRTGIPFVAGFRDPWSGFESSTPERWFIPKAIDQKLEHSIFRDATMIDVAWEGIALDARGKYPELPRDKFVHIPNGFDSADFPEPDIIKRAHRNRSEKFILTYSGSLYGPRNPASLFAALNILLSNDRIDPKKITLRFVGRFSTEIHEMMAAPEIAPMIEKFDYVAHSKAVELVSDSDALLLVVDDTPSVAEIVPGKVYEYLGAMRPMLAIAPPDGAIGRLLRETGGGIAVAAKDIEGQALAFKQLYDLWLSGASASSGMNFETIKQYERREATRKLAEVFDNVTHKK
ncbi:MAG TPA: glycosyltransferase family 4 protein [Candidatus Kapabacteria bacterium]|nr:glycosyltransferase family 4 protein [Candidatus Kapabacteria bacterium]